MKLMVPQKRMLTSALELDAIRTDRFKTETLSVTVTVPVDKHLTPLYVFALSILKRGTVQYPSQGALNRRLDDLYATGISLKVDRFGSNCLLGFGADMLGREYTDGEIDVFDGTLDVILQMLFHPLMDEDGMFLSKYIESERENLCDIIESQVNNPRSYASRRCREIMFDGDDYGVDLLGEVEQIRAITAEQLRDAYLDLIQNHRFRVFYVGSKSVDELEERLTRRLAPYILSGTKVSPKDTVCDGNVSCCRHIEEHMELTQGKLVIGFRTGIHVSHNDLYAMMVCNEIFGGSAVSKLFMNVREKMSLCYYCSSSYHIHKGVIFASAGVAPEDREVAENEILHQLEEIRLGHVSEDEFKAAIRSLINNYRAISDLPSTLESYYVGRDLFGVNCTVEECMAHLSRVTMEDVLRVSRQILPDTVYFLYGDMTEEGEEGDDFGDEA